MKLKYLISVILLFFFIGIDANTISYSKNFEYLSIKALCVSKPLKNISIINILDKGAKASPGFDNTSIIQYCLDNYSIVYIPAGIYEYSNILIRKTGVKLYGDGKGKTILQTTRVADTPQHSQPNIRILRSNCSIENLTSTYKNLPNFKQNAIGRNAINEDANISIGWSEVYTHSKSFLVENVTVQNCEVIGSIVQGIAIGVSNNVRILKNIIKQTRGTGIFGYYSNGISVIGNDISNTGDDGIYIAANGDTKYSPYGRNSNVLITKNKISNSSAKGIGISGCENAEISFNIINSTFADGILVSKDHAGGHVSPKNVKIHDNTLCNIFGEFGSNYKHIVSAVDELKGFFAMIGIITDELDSADNAYEVYNNTAVADSRLINKYGYYGTYVFGYNVKIYNNKYSNGYFGIMIGNPSSSSFNETSGITLQKNEFKDFSRNVVMINSSDISIIDNFFGEAEWCITEETVNNVSIVNNFFNTESRFFLNQTGSKVLKVNNKFNIIN